MRTTQRMHSNRLEIDERFCVHSIEGRSAASVAFVFALTKWEVTATARIPKSYKISSLSTSHGARLFFTIRYVSNFFFLILRRCEFYLRTSQLKTEKKYATKSSYQTRHGVRKKERRDRLQGEKGGGTAKWRQNEKSK